MKRGSALIDGEAVIEEESGVSNFTALQEVLTTSCISAATTSRRCPSSTARHCWRAASMSFRRVRFSEHIETDGKAMLQKACRLGLEGIARTSRTDPGA